MARRVKILKFTVSEIADIEKTVNETFDDLEKKGCHIITTQIETFGLSPMWYMVSIFYDNHSKKENE